MDKKWIKKQEPCIEKVALISKKLNITRIISSLLVQKQIDTFAAAKDFFRPSLDNLYDPFLLRDMQKAINRIMLSLQKKEKILIYGDYDVDGSTAVTLMYDFLKKNDFNCEFYIPDRYEEGYGISEKGIHWAKYNNIDLIISLDCGIRANKCISLAKDFGIDVIVGDHHEQGDELPPAFAIVNPKQKKCKYPFKGLSGCGIAFKIVQALCLQNELRYQKIYDYLDLVAVSIAADIVPIIDENRILTYNGLKILEQCPRPGLEALKQLIGIENRITISKIVFAIAPRINAAGRIKHANQAVDLLVSNNLETAQKLAEEINKNNIIRKSIDSDITEEAFAMVDAEFLQQKSIVLFKEGWHKGVLGIVASKCVEKYHKPTIIMAMSGDKITGSVRSINGFNVYNAIANCGNLLDKFGGHEYAAGITLNLDNLINFKAKFIQIVDKTLDKSLLQPVLHIDLPISLKEINWKMFNIIKQMGPFGPGNMIPLFSTDNLTARYYKIIKKDHIKLYVNELDSNVKFEAIGFNLAFLEEHVKDNKVFKMAYQIEENIYNGNKKFSLLIKDIQPASS